MNPAWPSFRIWRFARKELREILRDRRTIITLVFMPVLLYPILSIAFNQYFLTVQAPKALSEYRIGIMSPEQGAYLTPIIAALQAQHADIKYSAFETPDIEAQLRDNEIHIGMRILNLDDLRNRTVFPVAPKLEIVVIDDSPTGKEVAGAVTRGLTDLKIRTLQLALEARGLKRAVPTVDADIREIQLQEGKKSSLLSSLIPLILVLMTITGAVYPAIDLTAGERERGTLEILMAAPIPRIGLLLAKYIAVMTVTVLTGLVNLTSMTITIWVSGLGKILFGAGGLTLASALGVFGLLLLMALFFSAVLLAVTCFARSFKEAQAYLIPIMLTSIAPSMVALLPGIKLGGFTTVTPLLNVVLMSKELFEGGVPLAQATIVVLSTLFYALGAIALAARIFGSDAVLYSEQGQIGDLFRRPRQVQPAATLTAALFCLAFVFAVQFVVSGATAKLRPDLAIEWRLLISMVVSIGLFTGFPTVWTWLGRVDFKSGWQLRRAPPLAFPAALLMGLSLWPFAAEAELLVRSVGISTLPENFRDAIAGVLDRWRATSPVLVLLAIAVVPAVVEELFFRGFLFNAFPKREHPWQAIFGTALLFGAFHILLLNILVIERLVPTALLGVALGWLRWQSRSVYPGMVLHASNNGLLVLMGLFPHWFGGLAEVGAGTAHVPLAWLGVAGPTALVGIGLAWWAGRKPLAT